jgi:NAD(P)-dependent dehydrogenase (short-subunit alcohol dehydrogenase family)
MIDLPSPLFGLEGKRALVLGASRGIGSASAVALARAGAQVTLAARSVAELKKIADALTAEGHCASAAEVDVLNSRTIDSVFDERGPFEVVVNSVGTNRPRPLVETSDPDINEVIDLNLKSALFIARAALRTMIGAGVSGSIITISSQMGHVGSPARSVYSATKHALEGMTKSLAWEGGPHGVRVNTIAPTFIETELTAPMFKSRGFREWAEGQIALGRIGRLDEIMGPVVFLAGDSSTLITGCALLVDGGWTAR